MSRLFLSGYTRHSNKGIHYIDIQEDKLDFSSNSINTIAESNPSYIAVSDDQSLIFSTSSREDGSCVIYGQTDVGYTELNIVGGLGKAPCHLYLDEVRGILYASNYHTGSVDIIDIADEKNSYLLRSINIEGSGVVSPDQDMSRCHMATMDIDNRYLIVVNLGTDAVYTFDVEDDYSLVSTYHTAKGMGPRHLVFDKEGEYAYLIGELDLSIDVLRYDQASGVFEQIEKIQIVEKKEGFSGAAIKFSPDYSLLYASVRGLDRIYYYRVDSEKIEALGYFDTDGRTPRDFGFIGNRYIVVGHQNDDFVNIFDIENDYERTDNSLELSEIVCVV